MMSYIRSFFSFVLLACLFFASNEVLAGDQKGATLFIEELAQRVVDVLEEKQTSLAQKDSELKNIFEGHIAIEWVGKFVLGKHWRTASDAQKATYLASYKSFI
ncbi:MAG: ABC transporter substrate-binding protein, partial [Rickettsiales bacterium]|nr:ABC transporter substrate-binding protein [Rickettsiales bacterium]